MTTMKIKRIKSGVYQVEYKGNFLMVMGGENYNPDSPYYRAGHFEIWTAKSKAECADSNCWASGARSKKEAIQFIKETF